MEPILVVGPIDYLVIQSFGLGGYIAFSIGFIFVAAVIWFLLELMQ